MIYGVKNERTREYRKIRAESRLEAIRACQWELEEVKWAWVVDMEKPVESMSEEAKERLRKRAQELKEIGHAGGLRQTIKRLQKQKRKVK